jgi:hypothetical protein
MTANDAFGHQRLYITLKIKRFYDVRNIADYVKVVSHIRKSHIADTSRRGTGNFIWRFRSWSRSDKLALIIAATGIIALIVTILTLLIITGAVML